MDEVLTLSWQTMTLRLPVAFVLGGIIGLERERRERPAGLRTHILVTVAAALLMMLSLVVAGEAFDPGRGRLGSVNLITSPSVPVLAYPKRLLGARLRAAPAPPT